MERTQKVAWASGVIVGGLIAASLYHLILGRILGLGYPANTFLYLPQARFSDFSDIFGPVQQGSPLAGRESVYFPFAYIPLFPLASVSWPSALAVVIAVFVFTVFHLFWRELAFLPTGRRIAAAVLVPFCSFPVLFCADRGNIEFIVFVFELAFFGLFVRGRYGWSALPLAAAIAMKAYPGALGVLLLVRRQYAAAALTGALTLALTLAAAAAYPGGLAGTAKLMQMRLDFLQHSFITNPITFPNSSNWLAALKLVMQVAHRNFAGHSSTILLVYSLACMAIFVVVAWYAYRWERLLWKQVYLLVALMIVLPQVSFDYKLVHLLLPLALFLAAPPGRRGDDLLYLALLGSLMIPKRYLPFGAEASLSALLNPLALSIMAAHIIWRGIQSNRLARLHSHAASVPA